jgi:hypothetical protein
LEKRRDPLTDGVVDIVAGVACCSSRFGSLKNSGVCATEIAGKRIRPERGGHIRAGRSSIGRNRVNELIKLRNSLFGRESLSAASILDCRKTASSCFESGVGAQYSFTRRLRWGIGELIKDCVGLGSRFWNDSMLI